MIRPSRRRITLDAEITHLADIRDVRHVEALPTMEAVVFGECDFAECNDPPTVEALATFDGCSA